MWLNVSMVAAASAHAGVRVIEEDFLSLDGGAIFDDRLTYDFSSDFSGGNDLNQLLPGELNLFPDEAMITVNDLAPGEYIQSVEVIWMDFCGIGCTTLEVFGATTSVSESNMITGEPEPVFLDADDLGENITSFSLSSFEGAIELITVTVVPAPGSVAALGLGGLCLTRRRR